MNTDLVNPSVYGTVYHNLSLFTTTSVMVSILECIKANGCQSGVGLVQVLGPGRTSELRNCDGGSQELSQPELG